MELNSTQFREAVKPQDTVAVVITLMGIAIAIFLGDPIIKLIGTSIAILGLVALYVTIKQRISDQVHLRSRRTTLPPPAFKTRVTQEPDSSTKRILFDDFQTSFAPVDDDGAADDDHAADESFSVRRGGQRPAPTYEPVLPSSDVPPMPAFEDEPRLVRRSSGLAGVSRDVVETGDAYTEPTGESFRVIRPAAAPASTGARGKAEAPSQEESAPAPAVSGEGASREVAAREGAPRDAASRRTSARETAGRASEPPSAEPSAADGPTVVPPRYRDEDLFTIAAEEPRADRTPNRKQAQLIIEDLVSDGDEEGRGSEPRGEFVRLVGQVLNAIARSIQARSIVFFWVNFEKGHLIPEAKVTTGRYEVRTGARIALGGDVVSQIARSGVPEVITDISVASERELIAYYTAPAETRSFVGVPVFFRREVVGVLAADSSDENGFDEVSVATLAEYTRLIAGLIRSYTEKYDLHLIARTLDAFERMSHDFSGAAPDPSHSAAVLADQIYELFDAAYAAVVLFDEKEREWKVVACASEQGQFAGIIPDMRASLVGRATRFAQEVLVEEITDEVRFVPGEPFARGGTFLAIPLVATTKCYGALAVGSAATEAYIPRDIELMRDLVRYTAMTIEVFNTNRAIESHVVHDEVTGLYNAEFLTAALDREIARARDFKEKLSFALIAIDMPASLRAENSPELDEIIAGSVGSLLEAAVRPYDTVGRYDPQLFGAVLVKRGDQDSYLWAEKLRKEVASRILAIGERKSAVTISVGIADLSDHATRDSMIAGARQALERARSGDGNAVILY